ncbi:hypothetical protein HK103_006293 [Boothiomyces macroporosus]|uniref:MSP domain-containing protein n=1 Tax=Boothiomyces macroporosus TaxID=261099 RepID=A0AAD5UE88_9FUNG|nr:hypothetical protein HK103_006293 [Boothiomyces macroporosus]
MPSLMEYTELNVQLYNGKADSKTVTIRNTTHTQRIFKVKTSAPDVILASPRVAVIEPGKTLSIKFSFMNIDTLDLAKSQKILIQSMPAGHLTRSNSDYLLQYWKQQTGANLQDMKFRVNFEVEYGSISRARSESPLNHVYTAQSVVPSKRFSLKSISQWFHTVAA